MIRVIVIITAGVDHQEETMGIEKTVLSKVFILMLVA